MYEPLDTMTTKYSILFYSIFGEMAISATCAHQQKHKRNDS